MMDVDHHGQSVFQRVGDYKIHAAKNFRRQRKIRRRPGIVMPANRHAHMIESLALHLGDVVCANITPLPKCSGSASR